MGKQLTLKNFVQKNVETKKIDKENSLNEKVN
jgi:hypothetical protein